MYLLAAMTVAGEKLVADPIASRQRCFARWSDGCAGALATGAGLWLRWKSLARQAGPVMAKLGTEMLSAGECA